MIKLISIIMATVVTTAVAFCINTSIITNTPASPSVIIYKTRADYSKYVPITLSDDKSKVISYPAPQDVYFKGKLAYPTRLIKNFWLDNRGIGINSAFIKLTYEEYSKLTKIPSTDELYAMIIDKNPFTEIIDLGNLYLFNDEVAEINRIIEKHELKQYKQLK